jgi:hypothetical protein
MAGVFIHPKVTRCPFSALCRVKEYFESISFIWAQNFVVDKIKLGQGAKGQGCWRKSVKCLTQKSGKIIVVSNYDHSDDTDNYIHIRIISQVD